MTGGSYVVTRKIEMLVGDFLPEPLGPQQHAIGRYKATGAPFGQRTEFAPVIPSREPADTHIMVANPRKAGSQAERILRRSYTYTNGYRTDISSPTGGLFFMCYQRDPRRQFISIQTRLAVGDRLAHYLIHRSSALFAVPPGTQPGGFVGQTLLA
jgi:deferrochelatase/peroxidase EfeB